MDKKKTAYFSRLALSVLSALRLHKFPGRLWERNGNGKRDWGNVTEHCLVVTARALVFARKLGLSANSIRNLSLGGALHDFDKRLEVIAMKAEIAAGGTGTNALNENDEMGNRVLREAGFSEEVLRITGCVGGKPSELFAMMDILCKKQWDEVDVSCLILHYVDGYTRDNTWAEPAISCDGTVVNDVDRRMQKNHANPTYEKQDREQTAEFAGHPLLAGRGPIDNLALVCHLIEDRLGVAILTSSGKDIQPWDLPEVIDCEIKRAIEAM